jgi:hypothetical protein
MLCGETVAVCCENRTEHTDTLWAVRTSQETQTHFAGECIPSILSQQEARGKRHISGNSCALQMVALISRARDHCPAINRET